MPLSTMLSLRVDKLMPTESTPLRPFSAVSFHRLPLPHLKFQTHSNYVLLSRLSLSIISWLSCGAACCHLMSTMSYTVITEATDNFIELHQTPDPGYMLIWPTYPIVIMYITQFHHLPFPKWSSTSLPILPQFNHDDGWQNWFCSRISRNSIYQHLPGSEQIWRTP